MPEAMLTTTELPGVEKVVEPGCHATLELLATVCSDTPAGATEPTEAPTDAGLFV